MSEAEEVLRLGKEFMGIKEEASSTDDYVTSAAFQLALRLVALHAASLQ